MEKLKVGDSVRIIKTTYSGNSLKKGVEKQIAEINGVLYYLYCDKDQCPYPFYSSEIELVSSSKFKSVESRSKQISQSLKQICTKGLVIKSEDIIAKVKESIGTEYVFGDTILRSLRHLRQDGILDYTADKHTREYTFR